MTHGDTENQTPSTPEPGIRHWGQRALLTGILLPVAAYCGTFTAAVLAVSRLAAGQLFAVVTAIALIQLSTGLLTLTALEYFTRRSDRRARDRADQTAAIGHANSDAITRVAEAVEQNARLIAEAVTTLAGVEKRLLALESAVEQVPDYGKGVIDGATMRANALGDSTP